jgi:hypothetical protein
MLIVFVVIGLLVFLLRWTFSGSGVRNPPEPGPDDFGLLTPVAVVETAEEAQRVRALLTDAGIRATRTVGSDGRHRVLVFSAELDRARRVGGWPAP